MKRTTIIGLGAMMALTASAAPLTPQQALERVSGNPGMTPARIQSESGLARLQAEPAYTVHTPSGTVSAYVFNRANGQGYEVLSADDAAYPVLGYSDSRNFDPANISPEFSFWMDCLGTQMEQIIARGGSVSSAAPQYGDLEPIAPLVTSKWNQDAPYNNMCPTIGNAMTYTGCVATSMAQLMYYHKYPEIGTGSHSYSWSSGGKTLSMNFGETPFDWADMMDVYQRGAYSQAQADAVAYLMKCCGYSMNMNYGTGASGTQGSLMADALKTYFKYDAGTNVKYRIVYSATQWAQMVHDNLKNVGPVVMNGHPRNDSGHSFICDGYDGNGYFHFNWGWGGMSDGWYLLEAMDPDAQGIGGSSIGGGFNYGLNCIFGARPNAGNAAETVYDNMLQGGGVTAEMSSQTTIQFSLTPWYPQGWYNPMGHDIRVNVGLIIEPVEGTPGETTEKAGQLNNKASVSLSPGSYYSGGARLSVVLPNLADGKYKLTIGVQDRNANGPRQPILCPYGVANYVYLTVSDGEKSIENVEVPGLEVSDLELTSPLYYDKLARYEINVKNDFDVEVTKSYAPGLMFDGKLVMAGTSSPTTMQANSEGKVEWISRMSVVNGATAPTADTQYVLCVVDLDSDDIIGTYGTVTMKPKPRDPSITVRSLELKNCNTVEENVMGYNQLVWQIAEGPDFVADLVYAVTRGYFDGIVTAGIYEHNPENYYDYMPISLGLYSEQPFMSASDPDKSVSIPVKFEEADPDKVYVLRISYTTGRREAVMTSLHFRMLSSGIDILGAETETSPVEYYNLQGLRVNNPRSGEVLIMKQGDTVRKVVKQ